MRRKIKLWFRKVFLGQHEMKDKDFKRWIRKVFCHNELPKGELLILWRDVDDEIVGWNASADKEELVMMRMSMFIAKAKRKKLEQITGIK